MGKFRQIVEINFIVYTLCSWHKVSIGESKGAKPRGRSQGQYPAMRNSIYCWNVRMSEMVRDFAETAADCFNRQVKTLD